MKQTLENLEPEEIAALRHAFVARQSARLLADEATSTAEATPNPAPIAAVLNALAGRQTSQSLMAAGTSGAVVPFGLVAIARALLARQSQAHSTMARAASTPGELSRMIGAYKLDVIEEPDATFLILDIAGMTAPSALQALSVDGRMIEIALPSAIAQTVQLGMAHSDPRLAELMTLLRDPQTSLFLS